MEPRNDHHSINRSIIRGIDTFRRLNSSKPHAETCDASSPRAQQTRRVLAEITLAWMKPTLIAARRIRDWGLPNVTSKSLQLVLESSWLRHRVLPTTPSPRFESAHQLTSRAHSLKNTTKLFSTIFASGLIPSNSSLPIWICKNRSTCPVLPAAHQKFKASLPPRSSSLPSPKSPLFGI